MLRMRNLVMAVVAAVVLAIPATAQPPNPLVSANIPVRMDIDRYAEILSITPGEIELQDGAGGWYSGRTQVVVACNFQIRLYARIDENPSHDIGDFQVLIDGGSWQDEGVDDFINFGPTAMPTGVDIFVRVENPDLLQLFDGAHRVATVTVTLSAP